MIRPGKIMSTALKLLFTKPATVSYPAGEEKQFPAVRGRIIFIPENCIGCTACVRDCPTKAIEIEKLPEKQFACVISNDRCIYCGQCVDSCPKEALEITPDFELAGFSRDSMRIRIAPEVLETP